MRRSFLVGIALGAALVLSSVTIANLWIGDRTEPLYLRIADDNFDETLAPDFKDEDGPTSPRLVRSCGIDAFTTDLSVPDHGGSSFVRIDMTTTANLNCLIGEARAHRMSLAITRGQDMIEIECLPGWPTRFKDDLPTEACPNGNIQPIFREPHPDIARGNMKSENAK